MKELLIASVFSFALGGGSVGAGMKFYADHVYESKLSAEEKYLAMNNVIKQTAAQQRIWQFQDKIKALHRKVEREGRSLTAAERNDLREWEQEITNLKGW